MDFEGDRIRLSNSDDGVGLRRLTTQQSADLYELILNRHRSSSFVITSNRAVDEWLSLFDDPILGNSALDRLANDALREWRGERADVEYVRILHLAATTMEATVDSALSLLLEAGQPFDYGEMRDLAEPKVPVAPVLTLSGQSLT